MNKTLAAVAIVAAALASGCSGSTDKSGGESKPTTLVLASADGSDIDGAPAVARFVEYVDSLSGGRVHVTVAPDWRTKGEERVLQDVAAGKAELGWSGTRAFDTIGVNSFRPLHAPFLIGSYPAQRAVVADGSLTGDMLASLDGSGLTGLALLADELRFPAAAEGPLLEPADFAGLDFGIVASNAQSAGLSALGARVRAMSGFHAPATDGLGGLETMWWTYLSNGQHRIMPFVTPDAALWPRTTVIVANTKALAGLSERDRDAVTRAATKAADWSLAHASDRVAEEMATACHDGARIATASARQLAALRTAAEPAYAALRSDRELAGRLARIEELVRGAGPADPIAVPEGCAYRPGDEDRLAVRVLPAPLPGPGSPGRLPAGTYRYVLTQKEIREGVEADATFPVANAGVWTWTLGNGRWSYEAKPSAREIPEGYAGNTCEGYYDVHGSQVDFTTVTVYASGECASKTWKAQWHKTDDGLVMQVTTDGDDLDFLFGAKTWERID